MKRIRQYLFPAAVLTLAGLCVPVVGQGNRPIPSGVVKGTPGGFVAATPGTDYLAPSVAPSADVTLGGHKIVNLGTPGVGTDAATKAYVDANAGAGGSAFAAGVNVMNPANWPAGVTVHGNPEGYSQGDARLTNDAPALQAIINANPGKRIYLPRTTPGNGVGTDWMPSYYCASTLTVTEPGTILSGDGSQPGGTLLKFPAGVTGLWMRGASQVVRDLMLAGSETWDGSQNYPNSRIPAGRTNAGGTAPFPGTFPGVEESAGASAADGIRLTRVLQQVINVGIYNFGRDAVNASDNNTGDAGFEQGTLDSVTAQNCRGSGFTLQGHDSNVNIINAFSCFANQIWGISCKAFLGTTFRGPQATSNGIDNAEVASGQGAGVFTNHLPVASFARTAGTTRLTWGAGTAPPLTAGNNNAVRVFTTGQDGTVFTPAITDTSFIGLWRVTNVDGAHNPPQWVEFAQPGLPDTTASGGRAWGVQISPDATIQTMSRVATPAPVTVTGTATLGSTHVTGMSTTTGIVAGAKLGWTSVNSAAMWVSFQDAGNNMVFPCDTRVLSVDSPTQITVDQQAIMTFTGPMNVYFPWHPPAGAWAPMATTTLTLTAPYVASGSGVSPVGFSVGHGVTLCDLTDNSFSSTATSEGTFIVLSVSSDGKTISFAQPGPPAGPVTGGHARMAMGRDTADVPAKLGWKDETGYSYLLTKGAFYSTGSDNRSLWIAPYAEGGQRCRFSFANIVMPPTGAVSFDYGTPDGWNQFPYMLNPSAPGLGVVAQNWPLSTVWPSDAAGVTSWTRIGATAAQPQTELWQDVALYNAGNPDPTVWTRYTDANTWRLTHKQSASPVDRVSFTQGAGSALNSEGSGAVAVNGAAGTGTGGLTVGNGAGATVFAAAGSGVSLPTLADAQAGNGTVYFGSDHAGALCRKDAGGVVHVGP